MAAFSLRNKTTPKKEPFGFGRKSAVRQDKSKPSAGPDETQIPGSDRDPSQTRIQPNAENKVLKRTKNPVRMVKSKLRRYWLRKTMVGVWNVAVF